MTLNLKITVTVDPAVLAFLDRLLDQRGGLTKQQAADVTDQLAELDKRLSGLASKDAPPA